MTTSLFRCPNCGQPLARLEHSYHCPSGHSFDIAAAGYTHLLPANQMHSRNPGDDKAMVAARTAFLDAGYYAPLREALCRAACTLSPSSCTLFDCGCGEGYYTAGITAALTARGVSPVICGIDISKFALRKAAKRVPAGEFAVASSYHLPMADDCIDLLFNVFSPLAAEEFHRVLRTGGYFIYVVPSARHLWEMKSLLYKTPYENDVTRSDIPGFTYTDTMTVRDTIHLNGSEHIMALFGMTPYAHKTPRAGVERLRMLTELDTQIGFDIHIYRKD